MSGGAPSQLPLGMGGSRAGTFANLVAGPNAEAVAAVQAMVDGGDPRVAYLWGAGGTGRTHIIEAALAAAAQAGARGAYLPLADHRDLDAGIAEGLSGCALLCLDDVDAIAGHPDWEPALFRLYNEVEAHGGRWLCTAGAPPQQAVFKLADLATRLASGPVYRLLALGDAERAEALKRRARERGFDLGDEAVDYVLRRSPRDMTSLMALLDTLDRAGLAAHRRLTVPFVREILEGSARR